MSETAKRIDNVIKLSFADLMKRHGFKKSGRTWHKHQDDDWLIVNVQASSGNTGNQGKFTINLGVYSFKVARAAGQREIKGKPKEYDSTIRERLGVLAYGRDHWWVVDPHSELDDISSDLVKIMEEFGLPWLDSHVDVSNIAEALKRQPSIESAAAALLSGNKAAAVERLQNAIRSRPAAAKRLQSWASKVGLEL